MIGLSVFRRRRHDTPCTIEIEHSETSLHAHLALEDDIALQPGDRVHVHGAPIRPQFGEKLVVRHIATVERATFLERQWTRWAANFQLTELYEVSFTPGRVR